MPAIRWAPAVRACMGGMLMRVGGLQVSPDGGTLTAEKFSTRIEKKHWKTRAHGRTLDSGRVWRRYCCAPPEEPCAEEDHRPALAAPERAARLRGRGQAWQFHGRRQRAADLP